MKRRISRFIVLSLALTCILLRVSAQDANQKPTMTPEQRIEKRVSALQKKLTLTDAQASQVKQLFEAQEKIKEDDKKDAKASHQNMIDQMGKILTPDQMAKFKEMQEQRMDKKQGANTPQQK